MRTCTCRKPVATAEAGGSCLLSFVPREAEAEEAKTALHMHSRVDK